jgi:hypothetical protein
MDVDESDLSSLSSIDGDSERMAANEDADEGEDEVESEEEAEEDTMEAKASRKRSRASGTRSKRPDPANSKPAAARPQSRKQTVNDTDARSQPVYVSTVRKVSSTPGIGLEESLDGIRAGSSTGGGADIVLGRGEMLEGGTLGMSFRIVSSMMH